MAAEFRLNRVTAAPRRPLVEIFIRKVIMKTFLRMMSDRQTTVLTLPNLNFHSLHEQNLMKLETLFRHTAQRVMGKTLILDVSVVRFAGAAFLTKVNQFASVLGEKQVKVVIAGDVGGLIRLVGWDRRFHWYPSLLATLLAWAEWRVPADSTDSFSSEPRPNQIRFGSSTCECSSCWNWNEYPA